MKHDSMVPLFWGGMHRLCIKLQFIHKLQLNANPLASQ